MRKVFLDDLPKWKEGRYKGKFDWMRSIGCEIRFIYDDVENFFLIVGYEAKEQLVIIEYNHETFKIRTGDFLRCHFSTIIGKRTTKYKYSVGEQLSINSGDILILKKIRVKLKNTSKKGYEYKCLNCGHTGKAVEYDINKKTGCSVCSNRTVKKGFNDMWTTNPNLAKLLLNINNGYFYSEWSHEKLSWKCPDCNSIAKDKCIADINSQRGLFCRNCSDGISYPEKVLHNFLSQLNCEFEAQKKFNWSENRKYDFYIKEINAIIEVHGGQHYFECGRGKSLEEEQRNDVFKKTLALKNGISNYIVIDARKSDFDFIKNSVFNSRLKDFYNLTVIDLGISQKESSKSLVKEACKLWNDGIESTNLIGEKLHLNRSTINKYLKMGHSFGWCDYTADKGMGKRKVVCINTNELFESVAEASKNYGVSRPGIIHVCRGSQKTAGGYKWMYKEDYEKYIEEKSNKEIV